MTFFKQQQRETFLEYEDIFLFIALQKYLYQNLFLVRPIKIHLLENCCVFL